MNSSKISVIIPVFNRENHIKNCLEIITCQSYKNLEIIVVDDGSSDDSVSIIKTISDERIKLIHHKQNQGLSAARNTGIDYATGKYIHFMDDDDEVNNEFYEILIKSSEKYNSDMSVCSYINQYRLNTSIEYMDELLVEKTEDKYGVTNIMKHGYVWRYLFKTEFLKKHHLKFENGRFCEDGVFSFMAVFYADKIVTVPKATYNYIDTPNSITGNIKLNENHKIKYQEDHEYGQKLIQNFAKKHKLDLSSLEISRWKHKRHQLSYGVKKFLSTFNFKYLKF